MSQVDAVLQGAQQRAQELGLPYKGALFPDEAYDVWQALDNASLIDVRTQAELDWVGRIPEAVEIEWLTYPGMKPNPDFLQQLSAQQNKEDVLLFLCRSGGRSSAAAQAAQQAGYVNCYNVLEGFEGDKDPDEHRNTQGGWRVAELPWEQS